MKRRNFFSTLAVIVMSPAILIKRPIKIIGWGWIPIQSIELLNVAFCPEKNDWIIYSYRLTGTNNFEIHRKIKSEFFKRYPKHYVGSRYERTRKQLDNKQASLEIRIKPKKDGQAPIARPLARIDEEWSPYDPLRTT